jgi:hypothetical protein
MYISVPSRNAIVFVTCSVTDGSPEITVAAPPDGPRFF